MAERHLVVVATRPRERRILERLGAGGCPEPPAQHLLAVTWNTVVDNHAAVFTRRDISHRVMLEDDGSARVRTIVTLVNESPSEPPSALLGFPLPATVAEPGRRRSRRGVGGRRRRAAAAQGRPGHGRDEHPERDHGT